MEAGAVVEERRASLWFTVRGAGPLVAVGWLAFVAVSMAATVLFADVLGPAGPLVGILAAGWGLARTQPLPADAARRYHVDDGEVTVLGPGRLVRRLPWDRVLTVTQDAHALHLQGPGLRAALPLQPLFADDLWFAVLERVVPGVASGLWAKLEDDVVRLAPVTAPPLRALAWWAYVPALAAAPLAGVAALPIAAGLAVAERVVALVMRHAGTVTLHPGGIAFKEGRGQFIPWQRAQVTPTPRGIRIGIDDRAPGLVSLRVPNFWAAAAVIQLRAQVGPEAPSEVWFRLRLANGGLAVVGEFDAPGR